MNRQLRRIRNVFRIAGLTAALSCGAGMIGPWDSHASGQCLYDVTILDGLLCSDGSEVGFGGADIDEQGNMAGASTCFLLPRAAVWKVGEGPSWLSGPPSVSESQAFALSDPDHIVGRAMPTGSTLYIAAYWENGQGRLVGLPTGANTCFFVGINSNVQAVGTSNNTTIIDMVRAIRWENDQFNELVLPIGPNSGANDINEIDQITGWMGPDIFNSNAFIWDNGETTTIPFIPGGQSSIGYAISNRGYVVGVGLLDVTGIGLTSHGIFWDGQTMIDLGTLPGHEESTALDLNDADQIVGYSFLSGTGSIAVLWHEGQIYDLNDLVVSDIEGLHIAEARAINNDGLIVVLSNMGNALLTPIGGGDCNANGIADHCDIALGSGDCNGNLLPDECEDCDNNGLADECDINSTFLDASPQLPFGSDFPASYTITMPPAAQGIVTFRFRASGLLADPSSSIEFSLNGTFIDSLFTDNGTDCSFLTFDEQELTMDMDTFNSLVAGGGGDADYSFTTDDYRFRDCFGSFIQVETEYSRIPFNDLNQNGILDICERPADINLDGTVDVLDLLALLTTWGACPAPPDSCAPDVNDDGNVDVLDLLQLLADWG